MDCPECYEIFEDGCDCCPGCGWIAGGVVTESSGDAPAQCEPEPPWLAHWRTQFEARDIYIPEWLNERAREALAAAEQQMRLVSVMFVDLTCSTAETRAAHPEKIFEVMQEFHQLALEAALIHDGFVLKFAGDGVMFVFGAPVASGADIENAVRAARHMLGRVAGLTWPGGQPLRARAGVATGEVLTAVSTQMADSPYDVTGEAACLAARLEAQATPGQILVCGKTHSCLVRQFTFEPTNPTLKDFDPGTTAWSVTGETAPEDAQAAAEPELAGLAAELDKITGAARAAGSDGFLSIVVRGEAGIGKTRLLLEAAARLARTHHLVQLTCSAARRHILIHPLLQWLRETLGLPPGSTPQDAAAAIARLWRRNAGSEGPGRLDPEDAPSIGYLFGLHSQPAGMPPERFRDNLFRVLLEVMQAEAHGRPIVLILDDLHWTDEATLAWLNWLGGRRPAGFVVCQSLRLEADCGGAPLEIEPLAPDVEIKLRPLGARDRRRLLENLLEGVNLPEWAAAAIEARAGGNPRFSAELARAAGELLASQSMEQVTPESLNALLPETLLGLVQWRLDHLSEQARRILQVGAVLGLEFSRGLLEMFAMIREGLEDQVRVLKTRRVLRELPASLERLLRFQHPLLRDVAYGNLLPARRRELHAEAVRHLEHSSKDASIDLCDMLAHHWRLAEDPLNAAKWLNKAAGRHQQVGAYREALRACEQAIEGLTTQPCPKGELPMMRHRIRAGIIQCMLGDLERAGDNLAEGRRLAERTGNRQGQVEGLLWEGIRAFKRGLAEESRTLLEEAQTRARALNLQHLLGTALSALGLLDLQQGRHEAALGRFNELAQLGARVNNSGWQADALNNMALVEKDLGRLEPARQHFLASLAPRRKIRDLANLAITLMNLGIIDQHQGRFESARARHRNAQALAERIGHRTCLAAVYLNLADLARITRAPLEAAEWAARGIVAARDCGDARLESYAENNLALALLALGRSEEAAAHARRARSVARRSRADRQAELSASLSKLQARLHRWTDPAAGSAPGLPRLLRRAFAMLDALARNETLLGIKGRAWTLKVGILWERGGEADLEEARALLRQIQALLREGGDKCLLCEIQHILAHHPELVKYLVDSDTPLT